MNEYILLLIENFKKKRIMKEFKIMLGYIRKLGAMVFKYNLISNRNARLKVNTGTIPCYLCS